MTRTKATWAKRRRVTHRDYDGKIACPACPTAIAVPTSGTFGQLRAALWEHLSSHRDKFGRRQLSETADRLARESA